MELCLKTDFKIQRGSAFAAAHREAKRQCTMQDVLDCRLESFLGEVRKFLSLWIAASNYMYNIVVLLQFDSLAGLASNCTSGQHPMQVRGSSKGMYPDAGCQ
jgi:hypothetical protein